MHTTATLIAAAVAPARASYVARCVELADRHIIRVCEQLAADEWNLDAYCPRSNLDRADYKRSQAVRAFAESITERDLRPGQNQYSPRDTNFRKVAPLKVQAVIESTRKAADAIFDAYIGKLVVKLAGEPVVDAFLADSRPLWAGSTLVVKRADCSVERWSTKTIINVSVHGKLFNQFPTRKVK